MWRDVVEISRLKNLILASITVPLGAHIALSGEWSSDTVIQIFIQACSVIFFMASGFGLAKVKFELFWPLFFGHSLIKMLALISALKGTLN